MSPRLRLKDFPPKQRALLIKKQNEERDRLFRLVCREAGLPEPFSEYKLIPSRKFMWDWAWKEPYRLLVETQGGVWSGGAHGRGAGIVKDYEKNNLAAMRGWRTLFILPDDLCKPETLDLIREALTHGGTP